MSRHTESPMRADRLRTVVQTVVVVLLAAAATVLSVVAFNRVGATPSPSFAENGSAVSTQEHRPDNPFSPNPTVLVVTDSMGGGVDPAIERWPDVLAEELGWNVVVDAASARGFLPIDESNVGVTVPVEPFINSLRYDAENYKADYIIVDGGRNDYGKDPTLFAEAYDNYLTELRAAFPQAKIIALVPSYITPVRAALYDVDSAAVRQSADKVGAVVLDPVSEGWFEDVDLSPYLWTDGFHLNGEGARFYTQRLIDSMRGAGVLPSSEPGEGAP